MTVGTSSSVALGMKKKQIAELIAQEAEIVRIICCFIIKECLKL